MGIVVVGLSHRTAPVTTREQAAFSRDELPRALERLGGLRPIREALILSTCNRVELIAQAEQPDEAIPALRIFLHNYHGLVPGELDRFLYEFQSAAAVRHMLRVASGLDSMVPGESQILGQLRDAYHAAQQAKCIGTSLNRLMLHTFHIARQVRRNSGLSAAAWSVSRAAVELARHVFGDLTDRTVLVVGAGKMSELTTSHLHRSGVRKVLVTNRTYEHAARLAGQYHGETIPFEDLNRALVRTDIVIASTARTSGYVIRYADVECALRERSSAPLLFIDIAVPRDVDPAIDALKNVHVCDIDGLQGIVASREREVPNAVEAAELMVESAADDFCNRPDGRELGPVIAALQQRIESICCAELDRHIGKLTTSRPEDRQRLEVMVRRIAGKVLHPLILQLKGQAGSPPMEKLS